MASIQAAPNLPQVGVGGIPANLTPQRVQEIFQKFKRMQDAGVSPENSEYQQLHGILSAIHRNQAFKKMQQQQQQQVQAQQRGQVQQQNGANGVAVTMNGVDGASSQPNPESGSDDAQVSQSATSGAGPHANATPSAQRTGSGTSSSFSPEQLAMLRNQIFAFKMLSRNMTIPAKVQAQLFPSQKKAPTSASDPLSTATTVLGSTQSAHDGASAVPQSTKTHYENFQSPYDALAPVISYSDHAIRAKRPRIPSIMPMGVDIEQVREDGERIIYNRILSRKSELATLPANIGVWDTGKSDASTGDPSTKLKALIEFKKLSLLQKQKDMRRSFQQELFAYDNLAMTANRAHHRRMKKQSLREARITEKLEKQQRDARETKEKKKQNDYYHSIITHGMEIKNNASSQRSRTQKLGRMMITHHQHMEREEQKRIERTAKQRLQALKANDEETYMKLLGQAKDSRISHLLKQTDGFLKQLAASVRAQQRNTAERYGDDDIVEDDDDIEDDGDEEGRTIDYYAVAHRIKEEVTAQPSMLIGGSLKEYQVKGLQWMISLYNNNLNGILADEMGLGKTIQTISLITHLIEKKQQSGPFLVIVPLSTLTNWNLEFDKWAPTVKKIVYKGPPNARKMQQQKIRWGDFQVLLTTYEYIIKDRPVLSKIKWVHMIVDEGHRMKNANSKLSYTLTQYYQTRYRLILTGTPLQNNLPELWALLNFVLPTIFKSVKSFDEWFNTPFANTGSQDKMELSEEEQLLVIRRLHKVLRPFLLRRLKKDVEKDLPDKQERVVKCRSSALQAKLYRQLVHHNKMAVSDGKGGKTGMRGLSNMLMQLRKLCNHPFVFEPVEDQMNPAHETNDLIWRTAGKFELLDRVLPKFLASGHRVLMFFQMTQIMNIMEDFLRLRGMTYLRLDGSTKSDDRSELLKEFNRVDSPYFCFLLSTRAGGLGLNLQTADTVIIYDSDWNPHQDLQAQDRAHRIGQKNEVRILRLITSNSVEEKILERAQFKLDMDGKVIQAGKFDNKSTNEERDALLRTLLDSAESADQVGDQDEMDDDDLNEIMARSGEELVMFGKMDKEREKADLYGPEKKLPRLLGESELPDIYLADDNPVAEEIEEYAGRGARERKVTKYDDGLTEEQWLMAVDADDDTIEDAVARKEAKINKRRTNKAKRENKVEGAESSPEPSRDSSETPQPRKRGRKPGPQKRKADEIEETPMQKGRKRGRVSKLDNLSNSERNILQKILNHVYAALMKLTVTLSDDSSDGEDGQPEIRPIIDPFLELVPKKLYPDYYLIIQQPMAMSMIKRKVDREEYMGLKEFREDVHVLCQNARTYNEDGSMIFEDANTIEAACVSELRKETEAYPSFADFDESAVDGQSTANPSTVGTPMASASAAGSAGQTKLKLTFNSNTNGNGHGIVTNGTDSGLVSDNDE